MVPSDISDSATHLDRMLVNQRRRHLVAQLMTARRWVTQLEDLLTRGASPSGYGAPLTPLSAEEAQRVLAPVKLLLEQWRQLAATHAPEQLEAVDHPRETAETKRWAHLLLRKVGDLIDETVRDASCADRRPQLQRGAAEFAQDARDLISEATRALQDHTHCPSPPHHPGED